MQVESRFPSLIVELSAYACFVCLSTFRLFCAKKTDAPVAFSRGSRPRAQYSEFHGPFAADLISRIAALCPREPGAGRSDRNGIISHSATSPLNRRSAGKESAIVAHLGCTRVRLERGATRHDRERRF